VIFTGVVADVEQDLQRWVGGESGSVPGFRTAQRRPLTSPLATYAAGLLAEDHYSISVMIVCEGAGSLHHELQCFDLSGHRRI